MKQIIFRVLVFFIIVAIIVIVFGKDVSHIIVIEEFLVVLLGSFLLSIFPMLELLKKKTDTAFCGFFTSFSKNALLSGFFISIVFILSDINSKEVLQDERGIVYALLFLNNTRPILYGFIFFLMFSSGCNIGRKIAIAEEAQMDNEGKISKGDKTSSVTAPDSLEFLLSRRELEVARLVAKGLTNAQIADELYISVATVKRHLATIFQKTDCLSRHELGKKV